MRGGAGVTSLKRIPIKPIETQTWRVIMSTSDGEFEDEGPSIPEIFQRAIDYWTPERIRNAVPFDEKEVQLTSQLFDGDESVKSRIESDFPGSGPRPQRERVNYSELEMLPYQSVGKVYARAVHNVERSKDKSLEIQENRYTTAFYIGQPTIKEGQELRRLLTVAHAFDIEPELLKNEHIVFVPASNADLSNRSHIFPILPDKIENGEKEIRRVILPNRSESKCISNDICVLFVSPRGSGASIDDVIRSPLQLVVKKDGHYDETSWTAIGYPKQSPLSMDKVKGNFIPSHTLKYYEPLTIQMDNMVAKGMSGGPWMLNGSSSEVNGIQSSVVRANDPNALVNVASPFFSEELLTNLGLQYTLIPADDGSHH